VEGVQTPESVHDGKLNIGQRNKETARLWKELEPQAKQLYKEMAQTEKKGLSSTCTNRGTDLMQCHAALVTDFIKHSVKEVRIVFILVVDAAASCLLWL